MRSLLFVILAGFALATCGCSNAPGDAENTAQAGGSDNSSSDNQDTGQPMGLSVQSEPFGELPSGEKVTLYHLQNDNGLTASIMDYGGIVTSVRTPDADGNFENVTLGFDSLDGYLKGHPYFGAIVGRYANRIAEGLFTLNGTEYQLAINNDPNHLHGGRQGFDKQMWTAEPIEEDARVGLKLSRVSPAGEENYPGTLKVTVWYWLTNNDELTVEYEAVSDADTVLNLTNHCYWNLRTPDEGDILNHVLQLDCDRYLPVTETMIPTGELAPVTGTPFDFTEPTAIRKRFAEVKGDDSNGGYDHCYVINEGDDPVCRAARVHDPQTGRVMEIFTDQPGIQFYSGNFLSKDEPGQHGQHHAFCLETQHFPDSPNQPDFPTTTLKQGEVFRSKTVHRFSVVKD